MSWDRLYSFMSGGVAGGIGVSVVYPVDLIKTRMQNQRSSGSPVYKSSIDCFKSVIRKEGIRGLYNGLRPQIMGVAPEKAIKLAVNDLMKSLYQDKELSSRQEWGLNILSGSAAGLSQVVVTNPLEITKIRLQIHGEMHPHKPLSLVSIVKDLGLRGLYKGSRACIVRDVPFSGIYFPTYSFLRSKFQQEDGNISGPYQLLGGTLAGALAAGTTTPADVIKTRLQVKPLSGQMDYKGIIDCYRKIVKHEGYSSLFKGVGPRVMRSAPQFGVTLYFYEMLKQN